MVCALSVLLLFFFVAVVNLCNSFFSSCKVCAECMQSLFQVCSKYVPSTCQVCSEYVPIMCWTCAKEGPRKRQQQTANGHKHRISHTNSPITRKKKEGVGIYFGRKSRHTFYYENCVPAGQYLEYTLSPEVFTTPGNQCFAMAHRQTKTNRQTCRYGNSMTDPAKRAESVKIRYTVQWQGSHSGMKQLC